MRRRYARWTRHSKNVFHETNPARVVSGIESIDKFGDCSAGKLEERSALRRGALQCEWLNTKCHAACPQGAIIITDSDRPSDDVRGSASAIGRVYNFARRGVTYSAKRIAAVNA